MRYVMFGLAVGIVVVGAAMGAPAKVSTSTAIDYGMPVFAAADYPRVVPLPGCAKPVKHVVREDSTYYELACTSGVTPVVTIKQDQP